MKKAILFIGLSVFAVSCKKQYSCSCTTTFTVSDPNFSGNGTYTENFEISEATKKQAKLACNEATVKQTSTNSSSSTICKLTK